MELGVVGNPETSFERNGEVSPKGSDSTCHRQSDRFIVVLKPWKQGGAKGPDCSGVSITEQPFRRDDCGRKHKQGRRAVKDLLNNKSRMSREVHVRFCESLGVKLPLATRL